MTAQAERAHAKLSPSAAHRWVNCPGSIRMSKGIERKTSDFADEGTAAHEVAAECLRTGKVPSAFFGKFVNIHAKSDKERFVTEAQAEAAEGGRYFEVDEEMVESVQIYVDYIWPIAKDAELDVEFRFDLNHISEDMFGTGDAVIYNPKAGHLTVVDFKYGRGVPVDPQSNPQLLSYGIGAARRHGNRPLSGITLTVIQPRCRHPQGAVRSWTTDAVELLDFAADLREAAKATEDPSAPLNAGEWCKFCPAAAVCPALRDRARKAAALEFANGGTELVTREVHTMNENDLAAALSEVDVVENWCRRVREFAHDEAMAGRTPKGWKLVEKRAIRRWKDENTAPMILRTMIGVDEEDIFIRKLASPAQVEKVIGKKRGHELADFVVKQSSGAVLVPEHDARPAVRSDGSEFEAVA